jgi:nucleoside-diphosphate-sugar epimerase
MSVLMTGSGGFVGMHLMQALNKRHVSFQTLTRSDSVPLAPPAQPSST